MISKLAVERGEQVDVFDLFNGVAAQGSTNLQRQEESEAIPLMGLACSLFVRVYAGRLVLEY